MNVTAERIEISSGTWKTKFKKIFPWIILFIGLAAASFVAGLGVAKSFQPTPQVEKIENPSTTREGWVVYEGESFSIETPKEWGVEKREDETSGAKLVHRGNSVELWIDSARELRFSPEQQENLEPERQEPITIDGREAILRTFPYKTGEFFLEITLPEAEDKKAVVFWLLAADEEFKNTQVEIIKTYREVVADDEGNSDQNE